MKSEMMRIFFNDDILIMENQNPHHLLTILIRRLSPILKSMSLQKHINIAFISDFSNRKLNILIEKIKTRDIQTTSIFYKQFCV